MTIHECEARTAAVRLDPTARVVACVARRVAAPGRAGLVVDG